MEPSVSADVVQFIVRRCAEEQLEHASDVAVSMDLNGLPVEKMLGDFLGADPPEDAPRLTCSLALVARGAFNSFVMSAIRKRPRAEERRSPERATPP